MKRTILFLLLVTSVSFAQWQLRNNGLPASYISAIDAIDQNNAVCGGAGIYLTTNSGNSWAKIHNGSIVDITMKSAAEIYAVTEHEIIRTTNAGAVWDTLYRHISNQGMLNYIKVFQNDLVAMADCDASVTDSKAKFIRSSDGGATFTQVNQSYLANCWSMDMWRKVDFPTPQLGVFAYSINGTAQHSVARTTDGGITWSSNDYGTGNYMYVIKMYDDQYGLAQGLSGSTTAVFVTTDGGVNWRPNIKSMNTGQAVVFVKNHPSKAFIATNNELFYSADSGKTWSNQNFYNVRITDMVFASETAGWISTTTGEVYWTDNKGNAVVGTQKENKLPTEFALEQNYPNPFNPATNIRFSLPEASIVTLKIFDILGREIKTLVQSEMSAGTHSLTWYGDNNQKEKVSTGIYLYSLNTNKFTQTRKMVLMK